MTKLSEKAMQNKKAYDIKYAKQNFKCKNIAFNTLYPDDIALLDWVKKQPEGGTKYIKRLIREDIERVQKKAEQDDLSFME